MLGVQVYEHPLICNNFKASRPTFFFVKGERHLSLTVQKARY